MLWQASTAHCQLVDLPRSPFAQWHYFCPITLRCQEWDFVAGVKADFTGLLRASKITGSFDRNSVRVTEEGPLDFGETEVPSVFLPDSHFDPSTNAQGCVRFRVRHGVSSRSYRVYFDSTENGDKPLVVYAESRQEANGVDNGSFERVGKDCLWQPGGKSPEGWDLPRRSGARVDGSAAHSGNKSVRLLSPAKGQVASIAIPGTGPFRVTPGDRCLLAFWTKAQDLNDSAALVSVFWYDAAKRYLNHEKLEDLSTRSGNQQRSWEWSLVREDLVVPPEAQWMRVFIASGTTRGGVWIDDVSLLPATPPELQGLQELQLQRSDQQVPPAPKEKP